MNQPPTEEKILALRRNLAIQRDDCLRLAPHQAMARILDAPQPAALVHAFSEEDLHILIREIGADDALPLIALASHKQLEYLLDQEIWQRDRIDMAATTQWIDRLLKAEASPGRMIDWLTSAKDDLIEWFLFRSIDVRILDQDEDPSAFGPAFFTYDSVFYIRTRDALTTEKENGAEPDDAAPPSIARQLLDHMAAHDYIRLQGLLLEAANILPAETEEEAYRLRSVRLAERGFLPFEEAIGLYQPLNRKAFAHLAGRQHDLAPEQPDLFPMVPMTLLAGGNLFNRAIERIPSREQRQALQEEFAALCNRIIVADRQTIDSRENLSSIVAKASGFIHLGLQHHLSTESESMPNDASAARALCRYHLEGFFRLGYGEAVRLKRAAEEWVHQSWFAGCGLSLTFWGETWLGVLGGLLLKRPLFFDNYQTGRMYREFADTSDIAWSRQQLEQVQAFDHLLARLDPSLTSAKTCGFLTYKSLLLTLWARRCLALPDKLDRIPVATFQPFFRGLFQFSAPSTEQHLIDRTRRRDFLMWLADRTDHSADDLSASIGTSLEALFTELEDTYGRVSADDIDPRYIHHFLLSSQTT